MLNIYKSVLSYYLNPPTPNPPPPPHTHTKFPMVVHPRKTSYSYFNFYFIVHNLGDNPPCVDEFSIGTSFFVIHILIVARIQSET